VTVAEYLTTGPGPPHGITTTLHPTQSSVSVFVYVFGYSVHVPPPWILTSDLIVVVHG
jgi:hypothetical protein